MKHNTSLALLMSLVPLVAAAQDICNARGAAEQDQIMREFNRNLPRKGDKDAEQAWAKGLHAALAAAAKRAEDCTRDSRKANAPAAAAQERECAAAASRQADELDRKYRGRTLSAQEQAVRRGEEDRLLDGRNSCLRNVKR